MPNTAKQKKRLISTLSLIILLMLTGLDWPPDLKRHSDIRTWQVDCLAAAAVAAPAANEQRQRSNLTEQRLIKISANSLLAAARRAQTRKQVADDTETGGGSSSAGGLQISITPRLPLIRVPVESNAMLKCLISSQTNKFAKKFDIHWSRYMYDENVYEQIDSFTGAPSLEDDNGATTQQTPFDSPDRPPAQVNRQQQLRDFLSRTRQETNVISELLIEASLSISPVRSSDNASYFCTATDGRSEQSQARIDLVALSRPVVQLERVQPARDSRSALVHWLVLNDGNDPIKKTILLVRNESSTLANQQMRPTKRPPVVDLRQPNLGQQQDYLAESNQQQQQQQFATVVINSEQTQWQRVDIPQDGDLSAESASDTDHLYSGQVRGNQDSVVRADVDVTSISAFGATTESSPYDGRRSRWHLDRRHRSFNLSNLLPGVTYNFRLAAVNDLGQSEWSQLRATMPNDIPAQISEVFLLSRAKHSLAFGWRRPSYDTAKTIRHEMQLFDLNRTLTLDAYLTSNVSTTLRTNFLYYFVNLQPGSEYHFHVRACSLAGCSAFSSPKLLASTLDGEPDEPLEVELTCANDRLLVSWLPPANPRGQLVNYTLTIESRASYLNQSNQWTVDEQSSTLETADNHTLSLETSQVPIPNTKYSVRVCAKNRSEGCGRMSKKSARSQCSTPAELPLEMPSNIKLLNKPMVSSNADDTGKPQVESLVLELPDISRRNGSIDCIQLVLIRLPTSYTGGSSPASLATYLPNEPRDVQLTSLAALHLSETSRAGNMETGTAQQVSSDQALAYLAEEIDPATNASASTSEAQPSLREIVLGDGSQQICSSTGARIGTGSNSSSQVTSGGDLIDVRVFDGALAAHTYYTGFLKLILVRPAASTNNNQRSRRNSLQQQQQVGGVEILTKYSHYFEPVRTGQLVPEVALPNEDGSHRPLLSFGPDRPLQWREIVDRLGSSLKSTFGRLYNSSSSFVSENAKLEALGNYISRSPPFVQLFQVGIIVISLSLFFLLLIYILTLPASISRRRRRKQQRQKAYQNNANSNNRHEPNFLPAADDKVQPQLDTFNLAGQVILEAQQQQQQQQQLMDSFETQSQQQVVQQPQLATYQQVSDDIPPSYARTNQDCPIHSSPRVVAAPQPPVCDEPVRRNSNHLCQQQQQQQQPMLAHNNKQLHQQVVGYGELQPHLHNHNHAHHAHHHHNHHHHLNQAGYGYAGQELLLQQQQQQQQYERNCRTMRRQSHQDSIQSESNGLPKTNMTLSHQGSVLALAKKINKSIPLALFGAVFECRLRNGWLREEYEQLPRQVFPASGGQQQAAGSLLLKLRPQLIVSRSDVVSALISGNDHYDASLVHSPAGSGPEKRIICAKSPLDADSVWDFWRLVYEQEVSTIVMLTQNEDPNTGEVRCAQYWPTCDNEETTILSPCNEFVQKSTVLPAKFKIRQETLEEESRVDDFRARRLTLIVMATRAHENEQPDELQAAGGAGEPDRKSAGGCSNQDDEEELVIVERSILQLQFYHWNSSSLASRTRLIKFVELANERHSRAQLTGGDEQVAEQQQQQQQPMLVHCFNGLGRSGLFAAMSFVVDELSSKLNGDRLSCEQQLRKINLFQLVSRLRSQRELLLSPYRLYELLYQLTLNCIPSQELQHC